MPRLQLEDNFNDILGKTRRGLKFQDSQLTRRAGITQEKLASVLAGEADESAIRALAEVLGLAPEPLVALARGSWYPEAPAVIDGFAMFSTTFHDMIVNSFLVWDPATREAAAFDTGADCSEMLAFAKANSLDIRQIFITHTHPDHIADLGRLAKETGAEVLTEEREPVGVPATTFAEGSLFAIGPLAVEALDTSGHSPGQTTFHITGLATPVAIVGDALFAGSMGGSADRFGDQRRHTEEKILGLPNDTVLAPGHGPLTTVAQEKRHNAFFAK